MDNAKSTTVLSVKFTDELCTFYSASFSVHMEFSLAKNYHWANQMPFKPAAFFPVLLLCSRVSHDVRFAKMNDVAELIQNHKTAI